MARAAQQRRDSGSLAPPRGPGKGWRPRRPCTQRFSARLNGGAGPGRSADQSRGARAGLLGAGLAVRLAARPRRRRVSGPPLMPSACLRVSDRWRPGHPVGRHDHPQASAHRGVGGRPSSGLEVVLWGGRAASHHRGQGRWRLGQETRGRRRTQPPRSTPRHSPRPAGPLSLTTPPGRVLVTPTHMRSPATFASRAPFPIPKSGAAAALGQGSPNVCPPAPAVSPSPGGQLRVRNAHGVLVWAHRPGLDFSLSKMRVAGPADARGRGGRARRPRTLERKLQESGGENRACLRSVSVSV